MAVGGGGPGSMVVMGFGEVVGVIVVVVVDGYGGCCRRAMEGHSSSSGQPRQKIDQRL